MAVRNVKPVSQNPNINEKPINTTHFVPPKFSPVYKVEIITNTETIDVTDFVYEGDFNDGVTESIGDFNFVLIDPSNNLSGRISEFDGIKIYLDYGTTATTLRFYGNIERKSNVDQIWLNLSGRSIAMITTGVNVTYSSGGDMTRKDVLINIIDKYFSGEIDTSGISNDNITVDVNYSEIPFWSIVEELCNASGYSAYIGTDKVFNYFESNTRKNETEAIVENVNLISTSDFAKDTQEIVTEVRVYSSSNGVPIIVSSGSDTTYTNGIVKASKIDSPTIETPLQAEALAVSKAASNKEAPTIGTIESLLLPTLLPGESVRIANPLNNIPPAYYEISSYRHTFSSDGAPTTSLTIKKSRLDTSRLFKKVFQAQNTSSENTNPKDMDYTIIYDYNTDVGAQLFNTGTLDNVIVDLDTSSGIGTLKVETGEVGSWTSGEVTTSRVISGAYLKHSSSNTEGTKFFVSFDRGLSFSEIKSNTDLVSDGTHSSIILRVDFKSSKTEIFSVGIYYK